MAALMRSVICLVSVERSVFLSRASGVNVDIKRYVRGLRRKPVKVLFPEDETEKSTKTRPQEKNVKMVKEEKIIRPAAKHLQEQESGRGRSHVLPPVKPQDELDGLVFERASAGDKRLQRLVTVARSRVVRDRQGKILLEGRRLICDALEAGAIPQMIFFSMVERLKELPLDKLKRATLVKVKFEEIKIWSDVVAPQGVIAIFARPDPSRINFANRSHAVPLSLICDNIREPGNLGTMLRCAAAAGCHSVLLTKGCVDAWEPKVLRAAMGAHFRLPIYPNLGWEDIKHHLPSSATVHVADRSRESKLELEDTKVAESHKPSKAGDYGWVSKRQNQKNQRYKDYDYESSESDSDSDGEELSFPRVDSKVYHEEWAQGPTALVIGGETQGLSLESVQLAEKTDGHRLFIPIVPDVDSLNSAMAASILLFEGRKQLLKVMQTSGRKWKSNPEKQFS